MGKKKKKKNKKGIPSSPKQKTQYRDPNERARTRREIEEILLKAKGENKQKVPKIVWRAKKEYTTEDILAFISDLKFKDPEENKKAPPQEVSFDKTTRTWSKKPITPSHYDRWYKLVTNEDGEVNNSKNGLSKLKEIMAKMLS